MTYICNFLLVWSISVYEICSSLFKQHLTDLVLLWIFGEAEYFPLFLLFQKKVYDSNIYICKCISLNEHTDEQKSSFLWVFYGWRGQVWESQNLFTWTTKFITRWTLWTFLWVKRSFFYDITMIKAWTSFWLLNYYKHKNTNFYNFKQFDFLKLKIR